MNDPSDTLSTFLDPARIETYLLARGWDARRRTSRFSVWAPPRGASRRQQLFLPLSREPHDYEARLREFVWNLADMEGEDRDVLITNLHYATADLVRIRLGSPRVGPGELPIGDGAELFAGARELMLASACAAIQIRPNFAGRLPQRALDYIDEVRLGQTEPGSYVVTVISDVAAPAQHALLPDDAAHLDIPFERQVTTQLVAALGAARDAAHSVLHESRGYGVFDDAVEAGVSANLCDAIATMGTRNAAADLLVKVSWASSRPPTTHAAPTVAFGAAAIPVMQDAVTHLRQLGPFENELVEGFVSRLIRGTEDEIGTIVIEGEARSAKRNVHVELPDDQYDMAVEAHRNRKPVRIRGTLYKRGRSWVLSDPGQLALEG
jgi:hypothetical protein